MVVVSIYTNNNKILEHPSALYCNSGKVLWNPTSLAFLNTPSAAWGDKTTVPPGRINPTQWLHYMADVSSHRPVSVYKVHEGYGRYTNSYRTPYGNVAVIKALSCTNFVWSTPFYTLWGYSILWVIHSKYGITTQCMEKCVLVVKRNYLNVRIFQLW